MYINGFSYDRNDPNVNYYNRHFEYEFNKFVASRVRSEIGAGVTFEEFAYNRRTHYKDTMFDIDWEDSRNVIALGSVYLKHRGFPITQDEWEEKGRDALDVLESFGYGYARVICAELCERMLAFMFKIISDYDMHQGDVHVLASFPTDVARKINDVEVDFEGVTFTYTVYQFHHTKIIELDDYCLYLAM